MSYRKYTLGFFLLILVLSAGIIGFNILADPYGVWHVYDRVGFNRYSAKGEALERMTKPLELLQQKPQTIFFGTSISNLGLDPSYYEELTGKRTYNMAVDSGRIYEIRRYIEYAIKVDPAFDEAVVELGITMFYPEAGQDKAAAASNGFDERQLEYGHMLPETFLKTALSFDACRDSWENISLNRKEAPGYPAHEWDGQISEGQKSRMYDDGKTGFYQLLELNMKKMSQVQHRELSAEGMQELKRIIELCNAHGVRLHLYIPPISSATNAGFSDTVGVVYEQWLRDLSELGCVYDFTSYSGLLAAASAENKEYFWDSNHMRTNLGNMVLTHFADQPTPLQGSVLTSDTIEAHLRELRESREAWKKAYPDTWQTVCFTGRFVGRLPDRLNDKPILQGQSLIHVDALQDQSLQPNSIRRLSRTEALKISGWTLTCRGERIAGYAVLENAAGQRYLSLLRNVERPDIAGFATNPACLKSGIFMDAALSLVPRGRYALRILEQDSDGRVYLSDALSELELTD